MSPATKRRTLQADVQFAKANGISEAEFTTAYNSFGVQTSLQQADDLMRRDEDRRRADIRDRRQVRQRLSMAGSEASRSVPADQRAAR